MYMNYRKKRGEEKERYCSNVIYSSKEEALNISKQLEEEEHITTIKIEWGRNKQ